MFWLWRRQRKQYTMSKLGSRTNVQIAKRFYGPAHLNFQTLHPYNHFGDAVHVLKYSEMCKNRKFSFSSTGGVHSFFAMSSRWWCWRDSAIARQRNEYLSTSNKVSVWRFKLPCLAVRMVNDQKNCFEITWLVIRSLSPCRRCLCLLSCGKIKQKQKRKKNIEIGISFLFAYIFLLRCCCISPMECFALLSTFQQLFCRHF